MNARARWEAKKRDRLANLRLIKDAIKDVVAFVAIVGTALVGTALIQLGLTAWSLVTYSTLLGMSLPTVPVATFIGFAEIAIIGFVLFIFDYLLYLALRRKEPQA